MRRESERRPGMTTGRNRGGARDPAPIALRPGYMKLSKAVKPAAGSRAWTPAAPGLDGPEIQHRGGSRGPQASPGTGEITPAQLMDCFIGHGYAKVLKAKSL